LAFPAETPGPRASDPGPRLRAARPGDARDIARVYVKTWRDQYAGILPDRVLLSMSVRRQARSWARALSHGGETVLVADQPGTGIVGLGSCGAARNSSLDFAGEIYTLYVLTDYQETGLGRALLGGLFKCLLSEDRKSAVIWVLGANPSRFFYQAMGGKPIAGRVEKLWGEKLREVAYGWPDLQGALRELV
jgi:ribosomal protein S18 acetylase RimI-like enzyme